MTNPLTIALPKGRLLEPALALFRRLGYTCPLDQDSRQLLVEDRRGQVQFLLVKAGDVAVYVEYGAADLGIVGQDILLEGGRDVYEPLPLGFGRCRLVLAGTRSMLRRWMWADTAVGGQFADSRTFPLGTPEPMKGALSRPSPPPLPRRSGERVLANALAVPIKFGLFQKSGGAAHEEKIEPPRTQRPLHSKGQRFSVFSRYPDSSCLSSLRVLRGLCGRNQPVAVKGQTSGEGGAEGQAPCPSLRDRPGTDGPPAYCGRDLELRGKARVATRYPNLTRAYFRRCGVAVEVVHLSGSIELAPSVGLADLVVDVVETGRTLRENGLVELAEVARCQATTVVNRVAHRLRRSEIGQLLAAMRDNGGAA